MGQEKDNNRISRSLDDYIEYYMTFRPRNPRMTAAQAADAVLKDFSEKELLEYEEAQLPRKNPEFRNLVKEYRDGILLFTLMEQKVWKKAVEDTTGLRNYYEANQDSFRADKMVDLKEYRTDDESAIREVDKLLSQRMTDVQIDSLINLESALKLRITSQTHEKGKSELDPSLFEKPAGFRTPVREKDGFFRIFVIEKTYPPGIKPFDKAKSESITRYQDYLEREWLKELEKKYPVKVDEKVFNSLFE
jgi:peptidyl-prolyl cis-trans isomerase SurA